MGSDFSSYSEITIYIFSRSGGSYLWGGRSCLREIFLGLGTYPDDGSMVKLEKAFIGFNIFFSEAVRDRFIGKEMVRRVEHDEPPTKLRGTVIDVMTMERRPMTELHAKKRIGNWSNSTTVVLRTASSQGVINFEAACNRDGRYPKLLGIHSFRELIGQEAGSVSILTRNNDFIRPSEAVLKNIQAAKGSRIKDPGFTNEKGEQIEYVENPYTQALGTDKILEHHERYSYAEKALISDESESEGNWCHKYKKLKAKIETRQKCHKYLMGEDLESLNLKELQQLEQRLERSLNPIRARKRRLRMESISEPQKKERSLQEKNSLQKELMERQKVANSRQAQWDHQAQAQAQAQAPPQAETSPSSSFMMRSDHQLALPPPQNICSHPPVTMGGETAGAAAAAGPASHRRPAAMDAEPHLKA